jgi:hypothetical protein
MWPGMGISVGAEERPYSKGSLAYVDGQRVIWQLQTHTNATPASWREFFSRLPARRRESCATRTPGC